MFSLTDSIQVALAVLAFGLLTSLPGLTLARLFAGINPDDQAARLPPLPLGLAVLPLIDSLATRAFGLQAALALSLGMAAIGIWIAIRSNLRPDRRPSWVAVGLLIVWFVIVVVEWIDIDMGGRLYQSFIVGDMVKHAATTQAILDTGAPPRDPFFLRPERVSYYYFFYTIPALCERLLGGLIDARAAVGGAVFWTGVGLHQLVRFALQRAGVSIATRRGLPILVVAVLAAGGLDIVPVLGLGLGQGMWLADPVKWNTQVTGWVESLLWVPHHVTALFAAMLGLIALSDCAARSTGSRTRVARAIVLAALCLASTLGLSVWVTLGLVTTVGLWCLLLVWDRRWRGVAFVILAGILGVLIAAPQIKDLVSGRVASGMAPVVPTVREFTLIDVVIPEGFWNLFGRFLTLPINYFFGFGVLALGSIVYWQDRRAGKAPISEFGRVLAIAAVAGLLLGGFLKSTLFNNDLGWRVELLPLFAGTVWTVALLERYLPSTTTLPRWRLAPPGLFGLLCLGWATSLYALVGLRAYPLYKIDPPHAYVAAHPDTARALRVAYGWADHHLPNAVLQHDPTQRRAFAFALYGHNATAVSDIFASLFGAGTEAVDARIAALAPIFKGDLTDAAVRATAKANGIDAFVVTKDDPAWADPRSFVWRAKADYASDDVRIISVAALGTARLDEAGVFDDD